MRALAALLCVLVLAALPASAQQDDTRERGILQSFLEDNLSGAGREVRIEGFAGALGGRATIDTLTIADADGIWLTLRDAVLDWNRAALLSGRLQVAELSARSLEIPRAPLPGDAVPEATAGSRFALPDLPISVLIEAMALERVTLGADLLGQEARFNITGRADLEGGAGTAELRLRRTDGTRGQLALAGGFSNATRNLALTLDLDEGKDGIAATMLSLPGTPAIRLTVQGDAPIDDFRADIRLATAGKERLGGAVTLQSARLDPQNPEAVTRTLSADLGGDLAPVFAPKYAPFFGPDVGLILRARTLPDGQRVLDQFDVSTRSLSLTGTGALDTGGWPQRLTLNGQIADPNGARVLIPLGAGGTEVDRADLILGYEATKGDTWLLTGKAEGVSHGAGLLEALDLRAGGVLRLPKATQAGGITGSLRLNAQGVALSDAALARAVGAEIAGQTAFDWTKGGPLRLTGMDLSGADYGLTGDATLRLPDEGIELLADLDSTLAAKDLTRFAKLTGLPALTGAAKLSIAGRVEPIAGAADLRLNGEATDLALGQPMLDPLLTGTAQLDMEVQRSAEGTDLPRLTLRSDHADIQAKAQLRADGGTATASARIAQLGRILPGLTGSGTANITASGDGTRWDITASGDLPGQTRLDWTGAVAGLPKSPRLLGQLTGQIGNLNAFSALAGRPLRGSANGQADLAIDGLDLSGTAALSATTANLSIGVPALDPVLRGAGRLTAKLRRAQDGRIILETADLRTPELSADLSGTMTETSQSLRFDARLRDVGIITSEVAGPATASGTATRGSGDWQLSVNATGPGGTAGQVSGTVSPDASRANLSMAGTAPLSLANQRLRPRSITGQARYDLRLNGPLRLSSLSGRIASDAARLTLPSQRLALLIAPVSLQLNGGQAQVNATAALSSGGTLRASGPITLTPPFEAALDIAVTRAVLRDAKLYKTSASGTMSVTGPLMGGAKIGGALDLGLSELRVPASTGARYANIPGLVHLNEPAEVRRTRDWAGLLSTDGQSQQTSLPSYPVDLVVRAPSRIFVRGRGLDAELGGQLRLSGTTDALIPQGRFDLIRGRVDILGKRLSLTEGFLQLQGAFDPFVRFAAQTQAGDVSVTLALEGQASAPELTLTSSPELPQDEILSLLLFGRDLTQISPLQAVRLASALRTLSGKGGPGVTGRLRQTLALDDLDLTTDEQGNIEARAGKYLSETVYSDVTVNGDGQTQINLNLKLSPTVTLRGRLGSDGDTGIGVYFEKDY